MSARDHTAHAALVTLALLVSACTTTETKVRVISRAGPFQNSVIVPAHVDDAVRVSVGSDVLTDKELAALEARLPAILNDVVNEVAQVATTDPVGSDGVLRHGTLSIVRVKVKAAAGRERHKTMVDCRLRVRTAPAMGGDVLSDVEGSALQLVQARNVSVVELAGLEQEMRDNGGRNPLLDVDDTDAAIVAACRAAIMAIVDGTYPDDAAIDEANERGVARAQRKRDRTELLRRARDRAEAALKHEPRKDDALAGALVDIGVAGTVVDASVVSPHYHDAHPLVQRAARAALSSLCAGHQLLPKHEGAVVRCAIPAEPVVVEVPAEPEPEMPVRPIIGADDDDEGTP